VAVVGSEVTLTCRGQSNSNKVLWSFLPKGSYKSAVIVQNCNVDCRHIDEYDINTNNKACNLVIDNVTMALAGTYACSDRSKESFTAAAELIVLESEPSCKSSADGQKFLKAGTEVNFTCSVRYAGTKPPSMDWTDEFDKVIPSLPKSGENNFESSITVKVKAPTLRPYTCKTYFRKTYFSKNVPASRLGVHRAFNVPDYVFSWTSQAVVKP